MYNTAKHCLYQRQEEKPYQALTGIEEELRVTNNANNMLQSYLREEIPLDEVNKLLMQNYTSQEVHNWKLVIDTKDAGTL